MLSWLGLARKAAEKQSGSLVKPSNQPGAAMPRNQLDKFMDNNIKLTAQTLAQRSAAHRARKAARGLVKVEAWVPADMVERLKKYERKLLKEAE